ncbi:MAG: hypothetical protein U0166_29630, partial [Acidobacteriota bacterium]
SAAASDVITVPLEYRPTSRDEDRAIDVTGLSSVRLTVGPVTDRREKPGDIGVNIEDGREIPVRSGSDVAAFVRGIVKKELAAFGIAIADSGSGPSLDVDIQTLWVEEDQIYKGQVKLRFTLKGADGKELWAGIVSGSATRWGRSKSKDNYNEVISDSLGDALENLVGESGFGAALRR